MMLERMPEPPEIFEPRPEFLQVAGEFRRQGLEHGLAVQSETHPRAGVGDGLKVRLFAAFGTRAQ